MHPVTTAWTVGCVTLGSIVKILELLAESYL